MNCPKCERGTLKKIRFKANGEIAFVCEVCGVLWLEDEIISATTGHNLEYSIEEIDPQDPEHRPVEDQS